MTTVTYDAPPTLSRFLDSNAFVRAIIGPVGSGKSSVCAIEILRRAKEQARGPDGARRSRFVVIRNTYAQLRDTTRKTMEQWLPAALGVWKEQQFTFHLKFTDVDSEVLFRALDRPEDVKKILSLEVTGAYINEAREIPKDVFDVLQTRVGRYPSTIQGGPTWFGIFMDSNPWATSHWGYELFNRSPPEGFELFEQPGGRAPDAENVANLPPGYYDRLTLGKDSQWIGEYVDGKYPDHDKGSIYGELISKLEQRQAVLDFEHPKDGVFASFDLGISDATAVWFWRLNQHGMPDLIDWHEATGKSADDYFKILDGRGYAYSKIWLPHDARARTFQTGISTLELFMKRYPGLVAITPELSLEDGIAATRWMLERQVRIHATNCAEGLKRLRSYRYEWDEVTKVFRKKPLHDWTSHTSDAARYIACVVKMTELMTRKPEPAKPLEVKPPPAPTFNELLDKHIRERRRGRA